MRLWRFAQVRLSLTQQILPQTTSQVVKKSGCAHTKSILTVAEYRAMSLMIGCKPKANSRVQRYEKQTDLRSRQKLNEAAYDLHRFSENSLHNYSGDDPARFYYAGSTRTGKAPHLGRSGFVGAIAQSRVETGWTGDPQTERSLKRSQDATLSSL